MNNNRIYKINEKYFNNIDTEEKAYWLGFITADAGLGSKDNSIRFNLQKSDYAHLEKFKMALNSDYPIKIINNDELGQFYSSFYIYSKYMYNKLLIYGLTERKSLTVKPFLQLQNRLYRHYWRGYFDGNGCLRKSDCYRLSLAGSKYMILGFHKFISEYVDTKTEPKIVNKIYVVEYGGNRLVQDIGKILYENCTIWLDRKKLLMDELFSVRNVKHYMQGIGKKVSSSKYVGVSKSKNKWRSRIHIKRIPIELGYFYSEEEAALVYNKAAIEYFGNDAIINII